MFVKPQSKFRIVEISPVGEESVPLLAGVTSVDKSLEVGNANTSPANYDKICIYIYIYM